MQKLFKQRGTGALVTITTYGHLREHKSEYEGFTGIETNPDYDHLGIMALHYLLAYDLINATDFMPVSLDSVVSGLSKVDTDLVILVKIPDSLMKRSCLRLKQLFRF